MLQSKFCLTSANSPLGIEDDLTKNLFEDDLTFSENCFELPITRPTNVTKQFLLISCSFTTIPGGWPAGRLGGWRNRK